MAQQTWSTDVDVAEYLARTGATVEPDDAPSSAVLRALTTAHVLAIPFENLDVVLGTHPGLALDDIVAKLVRRRRGGYCYEHVLLLGAVLTRFGFDVRRVLSRVPPTGGVRTHAALLVRSPADREPDVEHLVDVGFGAGMLVPMRLHDPAPVSQAGFPHRLTPDEIDGVPGWVLASAPAGTHPMGTAPDGTESEAATWTPRHRFDRIRATPADLEVAHHYVSTHPRSPFTGQVVVMRLEPGLSRRLVGSTLTHERSDGRVRTDHIGPDQLVDTLRELDVELDDTEQQALLTVLHPSDQP